MQTHGGKILKKDPKNGQRIFQFFISQTSYLDFDLLFYQSVLVVLNYNYSLNETKNSIIEILSRLEIFVQKYLSKFTSKNASIMKKKSLMIYFSQTVINLLFKYKEYNKLNKFILFFDENAKLFKELKNVFMMINDSNE